MNSVSNIFQNYELDIGALFDLNNNITYPNYVFNFNATSTTFGEIASFSVPYAMLINGVTVYNNGSIAVNNFQIKIGNMLIGYPTQANNQNSDSLNNTPMILQPALEYTVSYQYPFYPVLPANQKAVVMGELASAGSSAIQILISGMIKNF